MSDASKIPPAQSASILPVQTQGNAISAASPARLLIHDVPVKQAPPALQNPPEPVHIEGRVISSNPQTQELRIATASGEVTVQSSVSLPPDTQVAIDLSMQKGVELATITLLRQQVQVSQSLDQIVQPPASAPPPPLQPGDVVQAIYLPDPREAISSPTAPTAVPAFVPAPLPLEQVAEIINNFPTSSLPKLPGPLPEAALQAATMPDVLATLKSLPAAQQAQISAYLARPDVVEELRKILPPSMAKNLQLPQIPVVPAEAPLEDEPLDDNVLQIVRVRTDARMAETVPTASSLPFPGPENPSSPPPVLAVLKGLLPLLEALQPQETPMGVLMQQLMTARPAGLPLAELMPQSMYEIRVVAVTLPDVSAPPAQPGETQGIAESTSPSGFPVIRVENDLFVLKTLATVPRGSTVTFQALALTPEQLIRTAMTPATAAQNTDWFHPLLSDSWPALQETLQAIATTAPSLLQNLRDTLPAATPRLAPAALFFLAALRAGDVESWLGEPVVQALRQTGRLSLVDRLTGDFGKIAAQAKKMVTGDWRAISMPLLHDDQISQLQFFVRRQHDDEGQKKDEAPAARPVTRFILNLRLSRMGDMQLDGLLHQKRFDLILRSAEQLPFSMRQDLMQSFARGLGQVEMAGGISFQTRGPQWVKIDLPHQGTMA